MRKAKHEIGLRLIKILNVLLVTVPIALCWYLYFADKIVVPFYNMSGARKTHISACPCCG